MYDNNSRIIINAKKVAQIEINSKGYPGTFNMVNGDVGIDDHNPPEMSRAAKKITQWINVKTPERFQHPLLRELENTPGTTNCFSTIITIHSIISQKWR